MTRRKMTVAVLNGPQAQLSRRLWSRRSPICDREAPLPEIENNGRLPLCFATCSLSSALFLLKKFTSQSANKLPSLAR